MQAIKVNTHIEADGELHLTKLPCRKGNNVEVIILITDETTEEEREQARQQLLALTRASTFKSTGPYPTRDELHERH